MTSVGRKGIEGIALALLVTAVAWSRAEPQRRRHVVLVTADTLRADHLSASGYGWRTSPPLDDFARTATRFEQAFTVTPKTGPSFVTMFSGLHPIAHGVRDSPLEIPPRVRLLAEVLREHGYRTGGFVSNTVLAARNGYARGFATYRIFRTFVGEEPDARAHDRRLERVNEAFVEWAREGWNT